MTRIEHDKELPMDALSSLRWALLSNATFSATSAVLLLAFPAMVGEWLGVEASLVYRLIGAGLLLYALDLIHQATRPRMATWHALVASVGDFAWVVGSAALLITAPHIFSAQGLTLVGGVAGVVFVFGLWQWRMIAAVYRAPGSQQGRYRLCLIVEVNAPPEAMWRLISDLGSIWRYTPAVTTSQLEGEPGVGAVRTCTDRAGKRWAEQCIEFDGHARNFTVRFLAEAPDFPFPVKTMRGGWAVQSSLTGSQVMVWWELTLKRGLPPSVLLPLFALRADRDFPQIILRMGEAARSSVVPTAGAVPNSGRSVVFTRLLPQLC
jgi:hypothetical protein